MAEVVAARIVGHSIADRMTAKLTVDALEKAVARRGEVVSCIVHADRATSFEAGG